ncbi:nuclear transport factor 2 family protein [Sphingomonas sp. UYP23]
MVRSDQNKKHGSWNLFDVIRMGQATGFISKDILMTDAATKPTQSILESDNEKIIRNLYQIAEVKDGDKFAALFAKDGVFIDEGSGYTYRGTEELARSVQIYATAMPDMHRELIDIYTVGDRVIVELSLNGTNTGPLEIPGIGFVPPTGKVVHAPCCDVFLLNDGKVVSFHCYQEIR